jgi:hypothetical protein
VPQPDISVWRLEVLEGRRQASPESGRGAIGVSNSNGKTARMRQVLLAIMVAALLGGCAVFEQFESEPADDPTVRGGTMRCGSGTRCQALPADRTI